MQTLWLYNKQMFPVIYEHRPMHFWQLQPEYDFEASCL